VRLKAIGGGLREQPARCTQGAACGLLAKITAGANGCFKSASHPAQLLLTTTKAEQK
jgi:hypothetical protein